MGSIPDTLRTQAEGWAVLWGLPEMHRLRSRLSSAGASGVPWDYAGRGRAGSAWPHTSRRETRICWRKFSATKWPTWLSTSSRPGGSASRPRMEEPGVGGRIRTACPISERRREVSAPSRKKSSPMGTPVPRVSGHAGRGTPGPELAVREVQARRPFRGVDHQPALGGAGGCGPAPRTRRVHPGCRLRDCRIGQLSGQRPNVGPPTSELLDHADEDQVLDGIDPEPGSSRAAPGILPYGAASCRHRVHHHAEVEAEPQARGVFSHVTGEMIGPHHVDGRRGKDADAVQFTPVQQHLTEAHVVHGRGDQASAAGEEGGRVQEMVWGLRRRRGLEEPQENRPRRNRRPGRGARDSRPVRESPCPPCQGDRRCAPEGTRRRAGRKGPPPGSPGRPPRRCSSIVFRAAAGGGGPASLSIMSFSVPLGIEDALPAGRGDPRGGGRRCRRRGRPCAS